MENLPLNILAVLIRKGPRTADTTCSW